MLYSDTYYFVQMITMYSIVLIYDNIRMIKEIFFTQKVSDRSYF